MPQHSETRQLPFSLEQLYQLVADIEAYPDFLPWCISARLLKRESDQVLLAELAIGYKAFRERYTSRVTLMPPTPGQAGEANIRAEMIEGPFKHLLNSWNFKELSENNTEVEFIIDFAFRSPLLEAMIGGLFEKAVHKMSEAFEEEARRRYR